LSVAAHLTDPEQRAAEADAVRSRARLRLYDGGSSGLTLSTTKAVPSPSRNRHAPWVKSDSLDTVRLMPLPAATLTSASFGGCSMTIVAGHRNSS